MPCVVLPRIFSIFKLQRSGIAEYITACSILFWESRLKVFYPKAFHPYFLCGYWPDKCGEKGVTHGGV